jgi:hypothetical protein
MFEFITSFSLTVAPLLVLALGLIVTVLIILANSTPPRIKRFATVNVQNDSKGNCFLYYIPNIRAY